MGEKYIISVDQSTQGTKALLFDEKGCLLKRVNLAHRQIVNNLGWVSHDLNEIYTNTVQTVKTLVEEVGLAPQQVAGIGISNQRETTAMWNRMTGQPLDYAIVWQCGRATEIVQTMQDSGCEEKIKKVTGIPLSAYFPAAKMAWLLTHGGEGKGEAGADFTEKAVAGEICLGTIDSWLVYKLTEEHTFCTDYSNASRTQLMNLETLAWDEEICELFRIPVKALAKIYDSNAVFGYTTMEGLFETPVPICGVLGDSHGALFGQGCLKPGMIKATYGTGSSLMMNVGEKPLHSTHGLVTSLAWGIDGKVNYVLEGNLNYTGAVTTWLKDDLKLIESAQETQALAEIANPKDTTYLVPAFTGLGAPYWNEKAAASISGITRMTGKAEIVKAGLECIAYQITDLVQAMEKDAQIEIQEIRVDGGPTRNAYLMQFQSDISNKKVNIPEVEELSGIGAAYMAGLSAGLYELDVLTANMKRRFYEPKMETGIREQKLDGWKKAVQRVLV